ncbi:vitamin k epoxide reductase [Leptolyngbya sp. Heron Island J]|uniref:vitamin K epoxide reductase family protein n=1 Tax=Leptolyngbya sp. Heron Island J TaxID=1385935 RepID=UPI0003B94C65|nr:vitamin K epoxide reductase family protein [Leptolyngbya sp. Heron Island J]ESA37586.1 vitamin k epoxide reductase [Leptolyngbya sp. Heron Island J]
MPRKRKQPTTWIHRNSRYLIAGVSAAGMLLAIGCMLKGNSALAGSAYVRLGGLSLPLLGAIAYFLMGAFAIGPVVTKNKSLEGPTWLGLFIGSTAMTIFSGYLLYVMFGVLQEACVPCLLSALLSMGLWGLTLVGNRWDSFGQLLLPGISVALAATIATTGLYAYAQNPDTFTAGNPPPAVETTSGDSEIALAKHLTAIGAKKYGAWWCPHCHAQQTLFGKQAMEHIDYIECDEEGIDPQPNACRTAGVQSYPTWEVNGQVYAGVQSLQSLATASGYTGPQDFTNQTP